jgi:aspartate 1-decarboxylase
MERIVLLSKLHHARITQADLEYEGSFSIDKEVMQAAGIFINEQVNVYNVENGERFTTYAIEAPAGSRVMQANGACAHKVKVGDRVIICTYGSIQSYLILTHEPTVLFLDSNNAYKRKINPQIKPVELVNS